MESLSTELILSIADAFGNDTASISAFSRANRRFFQILAPALYRADARTGEPASLRWAAHHNMAETAKRALTAGCCVNQEWRETANTEHYYQTPLSFAVIWGNTELVQLFLDSGAEIDVPADPVFLSAEELKSSVFFKGRKDMWSPWEDPVFESRPESHLGTRGFTYWALDRWQQDGGSSVISATPLYLSIFVRHNTITKLLLDMGATTASTADGNQISALHLAVARGFDKAVEWLLQAGMNPGQFDQCGLQPLHYLAFCRDSQAARRVVRLFLSFGANLNLGCETPDDDNAWRSPWEGKSPVGFCADMKNDAAVSALLEAGADPDMFNSQGSRGRSVLHPLLCPGRPERYLAEGWHKERATVDRLTTVLLVLNSGKAIDFSEPCSSCGDTPLAAASRTDKFTEIVELLLKHGARVDDTDASRQTALLFAASNLNARAVGILLNAGANVHHRSDMGRTAMDLVMKKASNSLRRSDWKRLENVSRLLLEAGASIQNRRLLEQVLTCRNKSPKKSISMWESIMRYATKGNVSKAWLASFIAMKVKATGKDGWRTIKYNELAQKVGYGSLL